MMQFIQNHLITIITLSLMLGILVGAQYEWSPAFLYILIGLVILKAVVDIVKKQDQKALRCAIILFFLIGITSIT
ncbi:hypothetical protein LJC10_05090, partial [Selenomonadales bacterium OttesenSCG-928-I06]|nr:hypothetical protein [Selenomonadales bacterium OttesenSCG-928-I06]